MEEFEVLVACSECTEIFTDLRSFPCSHSLCVGCIGSMSGQGGVLCCPYCQLNTPVLNGVHHMAENSRRDNSLLNQHADNASTVLIEKKQDVFEIDIQPIPATINELPRTCPVCEWTLVTSTTRTLGCGHCVCVRCMGFLLPVGGGSIHCPTCSIQTLIHPQPPIETAPDNDTEQLQQQQLWKQQWLQKRLRKRQQQQQLQQQQQQRKQQQQDQQRQTQRQQDKRKRERQQERQQERQRARQQELQAMGEQLQELLQRQERVCSTMSAAMAAAAAAGLEQPELQ